MSLFQAPALSSECSVFRGGRPKAKRDQSGLYQLAGLVLTWVALSGFLPAAHAGENEEVAVVMSRVGADYVRLKLPNGTFPVETYTFGEGGFTAGSVRDPSTSKLNFTTVARTIAGALASQNYRPGTDPKELKLLIMIYWGTTTGTSDAKYSPGYAALQGAQHMTPLPQSKSDVMIHGNGGNTIGPEGAMYLKMVEIENRVRDQTDLRNAGVLGYDSALSATDGIAISALRSIRGDLLDDIEDNRYFVVLMAYDFQLMMKRKKPKLLWETRFSVRELGNAFDQKLAAMATSASCYFGQDSHGLARRPVPEGKVTLGETKAMNVIEPK